MIAVLDAYSSSRSKINGYVNESWSHRDFLSHWNHQYASLNEAYPPRTYVGEEGCSEDTFGSHNRLRM